MLMTAGELFDDGVVGSEVSLKVLRGLLRVGVEAATVRTRSLLVVAIIVEGVAGVVTVAVVMATMLLVGVGGSLDCRGWVGSIRGESFEEPILVMTLVGMLGRVWPGTLGRL